MRGASLRAGDFTGVRWEYATMDHWSGIKRLCDIQTTEVKLRLATSLEALQLILASSLFPGSDARVIVAVEGAGIRGYAVAINTQYPGPVTLKRTLCHSIFVEPGANLQTSLQLIKGVEAFARESQAKVYYGHIRPGGPVEAWLRKFRLDHLYTVVGKEL